MSHNQDNRLVLATIVSEKDDVIDEGVLHCSNPDCQLEYPIIDGIPLLVPNIRQYIADNLPHITARNDLSGLTESIIGDCAGANSLYDFTRQYLSSYAWSHYEDLNPDRDQHDFPHEDSIAYYLDAGLDLLGDYPASNSSCAPIIDLGCSVGRTSFELAGKYGALTLGIDINFSMLQVAQRVLRDGIVHYPLRRIGVVYDRQEFRVELKSSQQVDFWACDASVLPFADNTFGFGCALNLLDSINSPRDLLISMDNLLKPSGRAILATPYDWSQNATPIESWIGGHSQRGPVGGAPEDLLRKLLTPGTYPLSTKSLKISREILNQPWSVRTHSRSITHYSSYMAALVSTKKA
jgi:SAM-dependent methyltransferase/uncharacterized protein YbaR (Trm112 family)